MKTTTNKFEIKTRPLFKFQGNEGDSLYITHPTTATIHTHTTIVLPQQTEREQKHPLH